MVIDCNQEYAGNIPYYYMKFYTQPVKLGIKNFNRHREQSSSLKYLLITIKKNQIENVFYQTLGKKG